MYSADTGPSVENSASSTSRAGAETRRPASRITASASSRLATETSRGSGARVTSRRLRAPHVRGPALLDVREAPDGERDRPGEDEQAGDDVADHVQVDGRDRVPGLAGEAELLAEDGDELDRADHQRDGDRQRRDRDVVVDLSHRLGE